MKRITSIDFVRGLVMLIMAIDHVRDLIHVSSLTQDPTDLSTTTVGLFLTRWITHLCAPTFVFLSGASAYFSFKNQQNILESRQFLISRGLWLVLLEFTVINFAIWFDFQFRLLMFQVIGTIGCGFIILSFFLKLKPKTIGIIGLIIIFGHNALQGIPVENAFLKYGIAPLFAPNLFQITPNIGLLINYPIIPWLGIMLAGFGFGQLLEMPERKKKLLQIGLGSILLFTILRFSNLYGDPSKWTVQKNDIFTFLSFINVTKYAPSLLYVLITVGISIVILAFTDGLKNRFVSIVSIYGKVPLFYYLIHWYLIRCIAFVIFFSQGFSWKDLGFAPFQFGRPQVPSGVELPIVYLIWLGLIIGLYPLCKWYGNYKLSHPEKKWLRYL
jgi:uncharacterized membrane protein